MAVSAKQKIRKIYESLPELNCGVCGYDNCGQFARAVAEGRASPFGCRQNPWSGYKISRIIGVKVPAYSYISQPAFVSGPGISASPKSLKEEVQRLRQKVDDILIRIRGLKAARWDAERRGM